VFSEISITFAAVMNWKFIISWAIKFALCTVVYNLAVGQTGSLWWAFLMALGFLIIIAIAESYVIDWIEKWKESRK
jgi:hypothetical protein